MLRPRRLIVKCTVWLNVVQRRSRCFTNSHQGRDLIKNDVVNLISRKRHIPAPESLKIGIPGMGSNSDVVLDGHLNSLSHRRGIAGMKSTSNIRRRNVLHELRVIAHWPRAEAFAHVTVKVDSWHMNVGNVSHFLARHAGESNS